MRERFKIEDRVSGISGLLLFNPFNPNFFL